MLNTLNVDLKTDIKNDRPTALGIKLMSQDKNNNQFILRFTNGGEPVNLDHTYTVEILTKFSNSGASRLTSATVRQDYATWEFDTAYITQDERVDNFVYVRKSGNLVVSADANAFYFEVGLSEIDKDAGRVAEVYDENYQKYLDEFKYNVDFEEIAQAESDRQANEDVRQANELLREENYNQKVDTAIVEADVVAKVDDKVTELTPQITNLTAQLAQKASKDQVFTMANMGQDVKEAMTGGSVAVVGDNAVLNENIVDSQITNNKLNLVGVELPTVFTNFGQLLSTRLALTEEVFFESGSEIVVKDGSNFEFSLIGNFTSGSWTATNYQIGEDFSGDIRFRKKDDSAFLPQDLPVLQKEIYVVPPNTITNLESSLIVIESEISKSISSGFPVKTEILNTHPINGDVSHNAKYSRAFERASGLIIELPTDSIFDFTLLDEEGISFISWRKRYVIETDDIFYIRFRKENKTPFTPENTNELKRQLNLFPLLELNLPNNTFPGKEPTTFYVSQDGDDQNNGLNVSQPLATLQKALDNGATNVLMKRGVYKHQSAVAPSRLEKLTILPYDDAPWDNSNPSTSQKIVFEGADYLNDWEPHNGIFRRLLSSAPSFDEVFINKTIPPMSDTSRPSPNAVLWEADAYNSFDNDYMMTPVLSLSECESTQGTFFWDETHIYVNPIDINNSFILPMVENGINLTGVTNLEVSELTAQNYLNRPFALEKNKKLTAWGCEAHRSARTDGFSLDYSYGVMHRPKANKNRNDGFNNHLQGDITIYDIEARNNFDDGASPHEGCSIIVHGGIIEGSGKGGLIPAAGGYARAYGVIFKRNKIGFHNAERPLGTSLSSGNLYIDNETAIKNDFADDFVSLNDTFVGNTTDVVGNIDRH